jgi:hypothetical protein
MLQQRQQQVQEHKQQRQQQQKHKHLKMNNRIIYILLVGLFASCGNQVEEKKDNSTSEILSYFEKESEIFTFSPDSFFNIVGKEGTEISISPECLVHQDGTLPTREIILELKECYTASDIVFNSLTTQTKEGLLETGGMIYLQAKSGDKVLKVKDGKSITIKFPKKGKMKNGMRLFKGKKDRDYIVWDESPMSEETKITIATDTIYTESDSAIIYQKELDYYLFNSPKMDWLNCDKFIEGEKTEMFVAIDTTIIPNVRIIFHNLRLAAMPKLNSSKLIFNKIPIGEPATIIGFYKSEGKYYIYKKKITVTENMKEKAVFREVTLEELKAEIETIKWKESV